MQNISPSIKSIIVDDEKRAINIFKELLAEHRELEVAATAQSVDDAIPLILDHKPDLIFLDVQMPGKNGFELLHELKDYDLNPAIIFVTAYDEYAITAIRHAAFDYLLKPVDPKELKKAIHRFKCQKERPNSNDLPAPNLQKVKFTFRSRTVFVDISDVIYLQAEGNYTEVFLKNQESQMVSMYLADVLAKLPPEQFLRISRSVAINLRYLTGLDRKKRICTLQAGEKTFSLKVPVRYLKRVEQITE